MRLTHLKEFPLWSKETLETHLGIVFIEDDEPGLGGSMPHQASTRQAFGLLHGGASAAFVESLGSVASLATIDLKRERAVGLDLQINHLRAVTEGQVIGRAMPLRLGRRIHVWQVDLYNQAQELTASGRLTVLISATDALPKPTAKTP